MKKKYYVFFIFLFFAVKFVKAEEIKKSPVRYVNPFVGTAGYGHTFPGAALPFGMVQASPETGNLDWKFCSGYNYADPDIYGFAQTHMNGTGVPDLGDILLQPFAGTVQRRSYKSGFSKKTEKASPGYYRVRLTDNSVDVELTATEHTAFHSYKFLKSAAHLFIDLQSGLVGDANALSKRVTEAGSRLNNPYMITGFSTNTAWVERQLFYVIVFDKPYKIGMKLKALPGEKAERYILDFDLKVNETLRVKIGISAVSLENAKLNLKVENPGWDFRAIKALAEAKWNELLSRVQAVGSERQKESLYTSLYHLFLQPTNMADVDGRYRGADGKVASAASKSYFSTLSLWDTYRAVHPLYTLLAPEKVEDMIGTLSSHYRAVGILPIWTLWGKETSV